MPTSASSPYPPVPAALAGGDSPPVAPVFGPLAASMQGLRSALDGLMPSANRAGTVVAGMGNLLGTASEKLRTAVSAVKQSLGGIADWVGSIGQGVMDSLRKAFPSTLSAPTPSAAVNSSPPSSSTVPATTATPATGGGFSRFVGEFFNSFQNALSQAMPAQGGILPALGRSLGAPRGSSGGSPLPVILAGPSPIPVIDINRSSRPVPTRGHPGRPSISAPGPAGPARAPLPPIPGTVARPAQLPAAAPIARPRAPTPPMSGGLGGIAGAAKALGAVAGGLGAVAMAAGPMIQGVMQIGEMMASLAGKANPEVMEKFMAALEQFQAMLGTAFVPIFEVGTQVVRMATDAFKPFANSIGNTLRTVMQALMPIAQVLIEIYGRLYQAIGGILQSVAPALAVIGQLFASLFEAIQPVLDLLVDLVASSIQNAVSMMATLYETVVPVITGVVKAIGDVISWLVDQVRGLLSFLGLSLPSAGGGAPPAAGGRPDAAKGPAKSTSIGSVESVFQSALKSAYGAGAGSGGPETRTATASEALNAKAGEIHKTIEKFFTELPEKLAEAIAKKLPGGQTAKAAVDVLTGKAGVAGTGVSTGYRGLDAALTATPAGLGVSGVVGGYRWLKRQFE